MQCTRRIAQKSIQILPRRSLHSVPLLRLEKPEEEGIPGLYTAAGYKTAWTDYQSHVIESLNRVSAETEFEHLPLVRTIAQTARQSENATIYNFAAQAFSNHFFFDALSSSTTPSSSLTSGAETLHSLTTEIEKSFSSIEAFKHHFSATAQALLGSGWVWLVLDGTSSLRILSTYNAGTPFDFARLQQADPNTGLVASSAAGEENEFALYQSMKRSYSLTPILCLSVWEHSYLTDYGFSKAQYVEKWMNAVDWEKVQTRIDEAKRG